MGHYFIFVVVAAILVLIIATLILAVLIQRRRQRIMLLLALAQEDANRRRKRHRTGLRRCEIDAACPEAIVTQVSDKVSTVSVYPVEKPQQDTSDQDVSLKLTTPPPVHDPEEISFASEIPASFSTFEYPTITVSDFSNPGAANCEEENTNQQEITSNLDNPHTSSSNPNPNESNDHSKPVTPKISYNLVLPTAQETCAVCLDNMEVGARVRALPCNHVFHSSCIRAWLRRKNACPCCCEKVFIRNKKRPPTPPRTPPPTASLNQSPIATPGSTQIPNTDRIVDRSEMGGSRIPVKNISFGALEPSESSFSRIGSAASSQFDDPEYSDQFDRNQLHARGRLIPVSSAISDSIWSESAVETSMSEMDFRHLPESTSVQGQQVYNVSKAIQNRSDAMAFMTSGEANHVYAQRGSVRNWIDDRNTEFSNTKMLPVEQEITPNEHVPFSTDMVNVAQPSNVETSNDAVACNHEC